MHQAKTELSRLVDAAAAGEGILARVPVAKLIPVAPKRKRILGQARGKVRMAPDFDRRIGLYLAG